MAIHDSYGTHACHMDALSHTLREVFAGMYAADDWLAALQGAMLEVKPASEELSALPHRGLLDLGGVVRSRYFFA